MIFPLLQKTLSFIKKKNIKNKATKNNLQYGDDNVLSNLYTLTLNEIHFKVQKFKYKKDVNIYMKKYWLYYHMAVQKTKS